MTALKAGVAKLFRRPWMGPLCALFTVLLLFAGIVPDTFARPITLLTISMQTVVVAIAAIGMTLVMIQGGIDLSVGSSVALTTVVVARLLEQGFSAASAALAGTVVAALAGAFNGFLVTRLAITPFIVTLGTMSVLRGAAKGLADEQKIDCDPRGLDSMMALLPPDRAYLLLPPGIWIVLVVALIAAAFLIYTRLGRHVIAIGSNPQTARLCGVAVGPLTVLVYTLAGALAGLAGVMEFSKLTVGDPTDSIGLELEVIAAVVIGGGSLSGGQGSIAGSLIGALLLTVINTGCTHVGLANWMQEIITGIIIVVAMGIDRLRQLRRT